MSTRSQRRWRIGLTVAALATLILAGASCFRGVFISHAGSAGMVHAASIARGALHITRQDRSGMHVLPPTGWAASAEAVHGPPRVLWTPRWGDDISGGRRLSWSARVPLWIFVLLLGGPAAGLWAFHVRRPPGDCPYCGYDLRGTPAGPCPECGTDSIAAEHRRAWRPHVWRVRRIFLRPVAFCIGLSLLIAASSSFYYIYVKVWMYGPDHVMLAGISGRTLCLQRVDYMPAVRRRSALGLSGHGFRVPPPMTFAPYWPPTRWVDAGCLGGFQWQAEWFPRFERRSTGWIVSVPGWNLAVGGIAFLVVLHLIQDRAHCRACGYDLKGLPGSICPECGRAFRKGGGPISPSPANQGTDNGPGRDAAGPDPA